MKRKIVLGLTFMIFLALLSSGVNAQVGKINDWTVDWTLISDGYDQKIYDVIIQNHDTMNRFFNLSLLFDESGFDTTKITNIQLLEQVNQTVNVTVNDYTTLTNFFVKPGNYTVPPVSCREHNATHYACDYSVISGSHLEGQFRIFFTPAKEGFFKNVGTQAKKHSGRLNIPMLGADDPDAGTTNGTKNFRVIFNVPPFSQGRVGFLEEDSGVLYHPIFNTSWQFKKQVSVTNNDPSNPLPPGYTVNLTFNHTELVLQGKSNADGTDVRIIEGDDRELDSVLCIGSNWDEENTCLYFNLTSELAAGATNSTGFQLYYGFPGAGARMENESNIFVIGETFDDNSFHYPWIVTEDGANCNIDFANNMLNGSFDRDECRIGIEFFNFSGQNLSSYKAEMWLDFTFSGDDPDGITFLAMQNKYDGWGQPGVNNMSGFAKNSVNDSYGLKMFNGVVSGEGTEITHSSASAANMTVIYSPTYDLLQVNNTVSREDFINTTASFFFIFVSTSSGSTDFTAGTFFLDTVRFMHFNELQPTLSLGAEQLADNPPTFTLNQTNGTTASTDILHSLLWADDNAMDSFIFSFDNGTGVFTNDSVVAFGATDWSNVSKSVNRTIGTTIRWQVFANDSGGRTNVSDIYQYQTTGFGNPVITVVTPTNTTFFISLIELNVSADQTIDEFWFSLNEGSNTTFIPNITISPSNGAFRLDVYANNTLGEEGLTTVFFTVDVLNSLTIVSPTSITFTSVPINLEVITNGTATNFSYSLNGAANVSFTPNTTLSLASGAYTLIVFANNSVGTQVLNSVSFSVLLPVLSAIDIIILGLVATFIGIGLILIITRQLVAAGVLSTELIGTVFITLIIGVVFVTVIVSLI